MKPTTLSNRLYSLDALRGFDMLWIMGADELFHDLAKVTDSSIIQFMALQLDHTAWNGFTFYDLIFPLFLFIAGVATPYSVGRELEKGVEKNKLLFRVIKRGLILILLGVIYNNGLAIRSIEEIRFGSVLGRIGSAYMFANIIYLYAGKISQVIWFVCLLLGYWLIMAFASAPGFPAGDLTMEGNFASYADRLVLPGKLYLTVHDPEGLFSTIPAIGTGLLGIMTGSYLKNNLSSQTKKTLTMLIAGIILLILAQLWNLVFPINKNLWTSSFVLQTGGCSILLLAFFYYIIDVLGYKKWAFLFKVIGMNSILIYMSGVVIDWGYASNAIFGWVKQLSAEPYKIVAGILCMIIVKWVFLYFMYKKKIFLKV